MSCSWLRFQNPGFPFLRVRALWTATIAVTLALVTACDGDDGSTSADVLSSDADAGAEQPAVDEPDEASASDGTSDGAGACDGVTCTVPPKRTCIDAATLRKYVASGKCSGGECSYAHTDVRCANGCEEDACKGADPCDGVSCTTPPNATCVSASTVKSYSPSGTCSAGTCTYTSTTTTCQNGGSCSSGTCAGGTGGWTAQTSGTTRGLHGIWGSSSGNVYAVGEGGTILHSTGNGIWSAQTLGTNFKFSNLYGVWGSGSGAHAVGHDPLANNGKILHPSGNGGWTAQTSYLTTRVLRGVWGSSSSDVYVVGEGGMIFHGVGDGSWSEQNSGVFNVLYGIWGHGSADIYVVGRSGTILHSTGNGKWTAQASGTTAHLFAVWGSGSNDVYAVGSGGTILHSTGNGVWTAQTSGTTTYEFHGIWGSADNDVYVVGIKDNIMLGTILHSGGNGTWTPENADPIKSLYGVWGSGSGDIYAVGAGGTILHRP